MIDHPAGFFEGTEMPTAGWWEALWSVPRDVLVAVGISPDMEVVDLCSGNGWFTFEIAKLARSVIAIDIDAKLLEVARMRFVENRITNCSFVPGDAYDVQKLVGHPTDFVFVPTNHAWRAQFAIRSSRMVALRLSIGISDHVKRRQY
jgi:SAM-dependent methyltransferase